MIFGLIRIKGSSFVSEISIAIIRLWKLTWEAANPIPEAPYIVKRSLSVNFTISPLMFLTGLATVLNLGSGNSSISRGCIF